MKRDFLNTPTAPCIPRAICARMWLRDIVYGTMAEAGANRYAAEQWQQQFIGQYESEVPIRKDFEVTRAELAITRCLFVGRPETNSALAAWSKRSALDYAGVVFKLRERITVRKATR